MSDVQINWPWQYNFPPFFTLQPHQETRARQILAWRNLVLEYFQTTQQSTLDVREAAKLQLFNNTNINRKLNHDFILTILSDLQRTGNAEPFDKTRNRWYIYWHTLEEWASIVYNYITSRGATNTVFTLYELTQGEDVQNEDFYNLDNDILIKVLQILANERKCELMLFDDQSGVKFF